MSIIPFYSVCTLDSEWTPASAPPHLLPPPPPPQVIYRALPPWRSLDPYSPAAQAHLMVTNLRVRLLQRQPCPCQAKNPEAKALPMAHYAIYDFIVKGSCFCNGHSEHCVPASGYHPGRHRTNHLVSTNSQAPLWMTVKHQHKQHSPCASCFETTSLLVALLAGVSVYVIRLALYLPQFVSCVCITYRMRVCVWVGILCSHPSLFYNYVVVFKAEALETQYSFTLFTLYYRISE